MLITVIKINTLNSKKLMSAYILFFFIFSLLISTSIFASSEPINVEINNALFDAVQKGEDKEKVEQFLKNGADCNFERNGQSIIMCACKHERHDIVKLLRQYKVSAGQSQQVAGYNIANYLEKFSNKGSSFIKRIKNEHRFCRGLSTLWLYSRWLDTKSDGNKSYSNTWFQNTLKAICEWDGETNLDSEVYSDFNKLLAIIDFFQNPHEYYDLSQEDIDALMEKSGLETHGKTLKEKYKIAGEFTFEQLDNLLKNIVYDDELIFVDYIGHITALFKHEDKYYYYDPSVHNGEIIENFVDKISDIIFSKANDKTIALGFEIWSFDEKSHKYPEQRQILKNTQTTTEGLIKSIEIKCLNCLNFYLEQDIDINKAGVRGWKPIWFAAQNGFIDGVKLLLNKKALDEEGHALIIACQLGRIEVVNYLLAIGYDPNKALKYNNQTPILGAAWYGKNEIIKILFNHGAKLDVYMTDDKNIEKIYTPYTAAIENNHLETLNLLTELKFYKDQLWLRNDQCVQLRNYQKIN
jgi:ankyrin repeat protein